MLRKMSLVGIVAAFAGATLVIVASPTHAATVTYSPSTITVTVSGAAEVSLEPDGSIGVAESGPADLYEPRDSLVVNATGNGTSVRLDNTLAGSLTINVTSDLADLYLTSSTPNGVVGKDLKIYGNDLEQHVNFDGALRVKGNLQMDLGIGYDRTLVHGLTTIDKNAKFTNVDEVKIASGSLTVAGSITSNTKDEPGSSNFADEGVLHVGKNFTQNGGPGADRFAVTSSAFATFGGNVTVSHGAGTAGQTLDLVNISTHIAGNLKYTAGKGASVSFRIGALTAIDKNVTVKIDGTSSNVEFRGAISGKKVSYTGTDTGADLVSFDAPAPTTKVSISTKGEDDALSIGANASLALLTANLGAGTDTFLTSIALPPKSKVTGAP